jgi:chorismate synthase
MGADEQSAGARRLLMREAARETAPRVAVEALLSQPLRAKGIPRVSPVRVMRKIWNDSKLSRQACCARWPDLRLDGARDPFFEKFDLGGST